MALGPRMGGGGGFRYDENERNQDDEQTSQALNRGKYEPSFVMNSDAYVGGQSRQQEERDAYERDAGHTRPQMSRKEEADLARLQEAARNIGDIKPPSQQQEPEQAKQSSQDQPRQSRNPFDNAESQQRQFDLSARLRGRMDALEANGGEKFGERKGFGSERMFSIAREILPADHVRHRQGQVRRYGRPRPCSRRPWHHAGAGPVAAGRGFQHPVS
ncbi:hypothetical protein [Agrobacterium radiobacter]|uniref:hypothetical protein n=1 Tax=Agrobacterium radiobacter TaxID=362 RepID=UPI003CE502B3